MKKNDQIIVTSQTKYLGPQSDPSNQKFVWTYEITINNMSEEIVQLLNRYWKITDLTGKIEEVEGVGVVGFQPMIKPGGQFVYKSFCQLATPQGTMEGHYEMQNIDEEHCLVDIPKFVLSAPASITKAYRNLLH